MGNDVEENSLDPNEILLVQSDSGAEACRSVNELRSLIAKNQNDLEIQEGHCKGTISTDEILVSKVDDYSTSRFDDSERAIALFSKRRAPLSESAQRELIYRASQGEVQALNRVLAYYSNRIRIMAWSSVGRDQVDAFQVGVQSLIEGLRILKGVKVTNPTNYLFGRIKFAISHHVADTAAIVFPKDVRALLRQVDKTVRLLYAKFGREPQESEIAEHLDISVKRLRAVLEFRIVRSVQSLDALVNVEDGEILPQISVDLWNAANEAELHAEHQELSKKISVMLDSLTARQRKILELRYGLDGGDGETLDKVGARFGITKQRVKQIEELELEKLKEQFGESVVGYFDLGSSFAQSESASASSLSPTSDVPLRTAAFHFVLSRLQQNGGFQSSSAVEDAITELFEPFVNLSYSQPDSLVGLEDLMPGDIAYWTIRQLVAKNYIREAFGGAELVITPAGVSWLKDFGVIK